VRTPKIKATHYGVAFFIEVVLQLE
jgi:hypothetical protein